jgi:HPt (histidine-containing phosphotransfer) domain-containing protein
MTEESPLDMAAIARLEEWGGAALRQKMIELFLTHAPERMEGIRKGLEDGEDALVERSAHSLKSSAANLGAERLRRIAGTIELAMEKGDRESVIAILPEAQESLDQILDALRGLLNKE